MALPDITTIEVAWHGAGHIRCVSIADAGAIGIPRAIVRALPVRKI